MNTRVKDTFFSIHARTTGRIIVCNTYKIFDPSRTAVAFVEGAKPLNGLGGRIAPSMSSTSEATTSGDLWIDLLCPVGLTPPAELKAGSALFTDDDDTHSWFRIRADHPLVRDWYYVNQPLLIIFCEDGSCDYFVEENSPGTYCRDHWATTLRGFGLYEIAYKIQSIPYATPAWVPSKRRA